MLGCSLVPTPAQPRPPCPSPAPPSLANTLAILLYTTGLISECIRRLISLKVYGLKKLNLDYFYYYHWNQTF